jgi:hypothetical protein
VTKSAYKSVSEDPLAWLKGTLTVASTTPELSPLLLGDTLEATYTGTEGSIYFAWYKDGEEVQAATQGVNNKHSFTPTEAGAYSCIITRVLYHEMASDTVQVFAVPSLAKPTISGTDLLIDQPLTAEHDSYDTDIKYQWYKAGNAITGATGKTYTPITAGVYSVTISADRYIGAASDSVEIKMVDSEDPVLPGNIVLDGAYFGDTFKATYVGSETVSYKWYTPADKNTILSNTDTFTPTLAGVYIVEVNAAGFSPIAESINAAAWQLALDSTFGTSNITGIAYGNGVIVAVGYEGKIAYSTDGINWTAVADSKFAGTNIADVAYGDGRFIAGGVEGKVAYSDDGITWTATDRGYAYSEYNITKVAIGNGIVFAVMGDFRSAYLVKSINGGKTWTNASSTEYYGFSFANGYFYRQDGSGPIQRSVDGATWERVGTMTNYVDAQRFYYAEGTLLAVGGAGSAGGEYSLSTDNGATWW